jgi:hypothetical protein
MATYGFNWSWVATPEDTKKASGVVYQGGGTISDFRQPANGAISSSDISAFARSVVQGFQRVKSDWRSYIRPILNSLPAGNTDTRWSSALGRGLPSKIDCFTYGIQGTTLFVFNDATSAKADGRYWDSTENRPKTIAEKFEDLYQAIADIELAAQDTSTVDLDPLWAAIGESYRDTNRAGIVGSLDTRTGTLETYILQLNNDIYDPTVFPSYQIGSPLPYSLADMLDALLKLHNVAGWGSDPSGASHSAMAVAAHTHAFTDVTPAPAVADTSNRAASHINLADEVKRLRYEIQATRGSTNWYSDVNNPWGGVCTLASHIACVGSGTASAVNPHGNSYLDDPLAVANFAAIRSFTGMSSNTDSSPTYSSVYYVTQGTSLETAIGALDAALNSAIATTVVRADYGPYDRSAMSATDRATTPIVINHLFGRKPVINVIDKVTEGEDYWGMYSAPTYDVEIDYPDNDTVRIWTEAANIEVIAFF